VELKEPLIKNYSDFFFSFSRMGTPMHKSSTTKHILVQLRGNNEMMLILLVIAVVVVVVIVVVATLLKKTIG